MRSSRLTQGFSNSRSKSSTLGREKIPGENFCFFRRDPSGEGGILG